MEPGIIRSGRRGRKRRRTDDENNSVDRQAKKQVLGTRSKALVGRYVKKEFEGSGIFLGKIVYYDTGLYRVDYEDGDCEDLESDEVREFLVSDCDFKDEMILRKNKLDELIATKYAKAKVLVVEGNIPASENAMVKVEAASLTDLSHDGANGIDAVLVDVDADSSSDSCEHARDQDCSSEVGAPVISPPQLPPSSGNIGIPEEYVSHLFSVYSFLRSFSIRLFLSPFGLDEFVGSLNCPVPNTLLDAVHVALMRALRRCLETQLSDGSELASKCLRYADWSLLDSLTWPVYLVQYLMLMGYTNGHEWQKFYVDMLEKDYCSVSAGRKLIILQILCDDVLQSEEIRAEIDMREESEVGIDSDAIALESGPGKGHHRYSKTFSSKIEKATEVDVETHETKSFCNSSSLGVDGSGKGADADIAHDGNGDECRLCGMDGTLLCCDGCPSAYHLRCIGVSKMAIPEGIWYCPECIVNNMGPKVTKGTFLRGGEVFGIDPYGQVFLGTCNHLLVLHISINSGPCLRYYSQNDIPKVLQALSSTVQLAALYFKISAGILQYWDIPEDVLRPVEPMELGKCSENVNKDSECSTPLPTSLDKECHKVLDVVEGENLASYGTESSAENTLVSCLESSGKEPGIDQCLLDSIAQTEHFGQQTDGGNTKQQVCHLQHTRVSGQNRLYSTMSSGSVGLHADPSDVSYQSLTGKSGLIGDNNRIYGGHVNSACVAVNMSSQIKKYNERVGGIGSRDSVNDCLYMGSHFKSNLYVNSYSHGDFAASAAANLAILSSEEKSISESYNARNGKGVVSANMALQVKAFSSAAIRFFWPNSERKLVEVPRERCGWCFSCKAPVSSKRGCLLNAAASNAIKGTVKILAGLRPVRGAEGSLPGIALYVMFMEESLCGLTVGPFRNDIYRKQWRKQVEQATTLSKIKALLLELEENISIIALSEDWVKIVDNWTDESSVTPSAACASGSTQKRGLSGRRGRRPSTMSEVATDDRLDNMGDFIWWRGGVLSKHIFQRGVLPRSMVKRAACQGGCKKIPGIYYTEGSGIPKRSRQFIWRAAVDMSKNASQLALQVRYLDLHVRWSDLVRPEQNLQDGKGPETDASAFRNAFVCDKKTVEDKVMYGVAFGNQKHLTSRVMKNIIEVERGEDGKEKYWFAETRIPLYLIKEYEEKLEKMHPALAENPLNILSKLPQRRQFRASHKDVFYFLSRKRDNLENCCCASCQLDVLLGNAVKCSACQGLCHEHCTVSSTMNRNDEVEFLITCKQCYHTRNLPQSEINNESPTSPLLLQGQELQSAARVSKSAKKKSSHQALTSVGHLTSSSVTESEKKRSNLSWGLVWKKKRDEEKGEDGTEFRLENLLPRRANPDASWSGPVCHLCQKPYNHDLMYIRCKECRNWYHADALELPESRIPELVGFKCCRCRRIRSPLCPYLDPETRKILEAKRPAKRNAKTGNSEVEPNLGTLSENCKESEPATLVLPKVEEVACVQEDNPTLFPISTVEQITEHRSEMDFECYATVASGAGPQKLPVRRHIKCEKNVDGISESSSSHNRLSTVTDPNNLLNPKEESSSPHLEWDGSKDSFEDDILFDYGSVNYENMECEPPQTYFSFTELLASDDGGPMDDVDESGDIMVDWENSSPVSLSGLHEQCGMGADNQQESVISGVPAGDVVPCRMCSGVEPCPDRCCRNCGVWIHSCCSPWDDRSYSEEDWMCGNCREWR